MNTKAAVITGASRGLGRSMALQLALQGVNIVGTFHNNETEAKRVVREVEDRGARATMLQLDIGDSASFEVFASALSSSLRQTFDRNDFDYLINNAGIGINAPFTETTEDQFDQLLNIHLKGPYFLTQKLLPLMIDGGRILNVSSGLARFTRPGYSAYAVAKGGVEVLTRYLAMELGARRIPVSTIAPGVIATDFVGGMVRDNPEINKMLAAGIALGRVGLPDDIGRAVTAILSDDCGWINGERIEVSGGQNL